MNPNVIEQARKVSQNLIDRANELDECRRTSSDKRQTVNDVKLTVKLTLEDYTTKILGAAGEAIVGKNAEERKVKTEAFLRADGELLELRNILIQDEDNLRLADLRLARAQDMFVVARKEADLLSAVLMYSAKEPDNHG
jgi:hypothetical protein